MERVELESMVREQERRAGKVSPFYMAKYIMGRSWMKNGKSWGWEQEHAQWSRQIMGLHLTRDKRPAGTIMVTEWCRDSRKSTLGGAYVVTALLRNPDERILLDSDTLPNAIRKLAPIREAFENEYFQELYGDLRGDIWRAETIRIKRRTTGAADNSVTASGTETSKTSQHYTIVVPDDKQTKENSQTPEALDKVYRDWGLYPSLMVLQQNDDGLLEGPMIVPLGTPWADNDLFQKIDDEAAADEKYGRPRRIYKSRKGCFQKYIDAKGEEQDNEQVPMFPRALTLEMIAVKRNSMVDRDFNLNYCLKRLDPEKQMFKREMFQEHSLGRLNLTGLHVYVTIDPAGLAINPDGKPGGHKNSDDNVVAVTAVDDMANLYILEVIAEKMDRDKLLETVKQVNREYAGPWLKGTTIERFFKQHELAGWLKKEAAEPDRENPVTIRWIESNHTARDKDARISGLQPYAKNRKIRVRSGMSKTLDQFIRYPSPGVHDDIPDAIAQVLDVMTVPGHKTQKEIWGSQEWREGQIKAGVNPADLPDASDVRTWRMIMKTKDRMRKRRGPGSKGYLTL